MKVFIQFQITPADMAEANTAAIKRIHRNVHYRRGFIGWIVFVILAISGVYWIAGHRTDTSSPSASQITGHTNWVSLTFSLLLIAGSILYCYVWLQQRKKKPGGIFEEEHTVTADDRGLICAGHASRGETLWGAFQGFDETPNIFLLYQDDPDKSKHVRLQIIPKRAFLMPEMLWEFRRLLQAHVHPRTDQPAVIPLASLLGTSPDPDEMKKTEHP